MWSRLRLRPATLAGQFLVLQLTVLLVVVAVASMVSVQQSDADFRDTRGAGMRAEAERFANIEVVREPYLAGRVAEKRASLTSYTQQVQTNVQASGVYLADPDGVVLVSSDFSGRERRIDLTDSTVQQLRPWTGDVDDFGTPSIAAQVPIINDDGELVGIAMVAEEYPTWGERARSVLPDLLTFAGLGPRARGGRLVPALAPDPAPYARAGARCHRRARRPARGAAALDPGGRLRRRGRRHGHDDERQCA